MISRNTKKTLSFQSEALKQLSNISEKQLQGLIIEPLLSSLGFDNVRDNSGSAEKGKDLVATKQTEFGRTKLYAIQIKKKRFTGSVHSPESLGTLFQQLIQARDEVVQDPTTNVLRSPDVCIFITPYPIAPSVWEKFHKLSQELARVNIEIIDGRNLLDLLRRHNANALIHLSAELSYRYRLAGSLNRIAESKVAFSLHNELELSSLYIDISLEDSARFFELIATHYLRLQGPKLIPLNPTELKLIHEIGLWFGKSAEITEPPERMSDQEKTNFERLRKRLKRNEKIFQVNLDSLLKAIQEKARRSFISLAQLNTSADERLCTEIALAFVQLKDNVERIGKCDALMDHWISLVDHDRGIEWSKPATKISSSTLNKINCNKFIVGMPGAGKTTLLRNLAREVSQSSITTTPLFLPLLLVKNCTMQGFVYCCARQLQNDGYAFGESLTIEEFFVKKAKRGEFQLFLDGLDEVGSDAIKLMNVINQFAREHPTIRIILSCRNTVDIPELPDALQLRLKPFSKKQLFEFIGKWFKSQPSAARELKVWVDSNQEIMRAASNPLVAALLCSLYYPGAEMPTTEVELYQRRFELLLNKWDKAKGSLDLSRELTKIYWRFITNLAFIMHEKELRIISTKEAIDVADRYFSRSYHGDATSLVDDCVRRGILEYESLDGLSFGHLTYQEYLVSRKLISDNDLAFMFEHLGFAWWRNVIRFYVCEKEDISSLIKYALAANCSRRVSRELLELSSIARWTTNSLIQELSDKAAFTIEERDDFMAHNDTRVLRDRDKRVSTHEAQQVVYDHDVEIDETWEAELSAYYDYLRHNLID